MRKPVYSSISEAVQALKKGGIAAFPTETVYGLGANAFNAAAVNKIFKAKGRPSDNPLIVHIADIAQLKDVASEVPPLAHKLAQKFWPGPLTLVLPKNKRIPMRVTAGLNSVAVRMPDHPKALKLLKSFGSPVAAPSANTSGRPSPTRAEHVWEDLGNRVDAIVDGGECQYGLESTVLDLSGKLPRILRPGAIHREDIEKITGPLPSYTVSSRGAAASPGLRHKHYSPRCALHLFHLKYGEMPLEILGKKAGVLCHSKTKRPEWAHYFKRVSGGEKAYAKVLFAAFREAEQAGVDTLYAEALTPVGIGDAVMDRLLRASATTALIQRERIEGRTS